jgi:hypothetical protein
MLEDPLVVFCVKVKYSILLFLLFCNSVAYGAVFF